MSDTMKPSERAAKTITETFELHEWGGKSDVLWDTKHAAAIIARETGCDANADIVRRLVEWHKMGFEAESAEGLQVLTGILNDAAALRRAGGW